MIGIFAVFFIPVCRIHERQEGLLQNIAKSVPWGGTGVDVKRQKLRSYEVKKLGEASRQHRFQAYPSFTTSELHNFSFEQGLIPAQRGADSLRIS